MAHSFAKHDAENEELQRLVAALCDGALPVPERFRLEELLANDPKAQEFFVIYASLHAQLMWRYRDRNADAELAAAMAKKPSPLLGYLAEIQQGSISFINHHTFISLLLLVVLAGSIAIGITSWMPSQPSPSIVAQLHEIDACRWANEEPIPAAGGIDLIAGRRLELQSGTAEIIYRTGAKVLLQGPAVFEINDRNAGFLRIGKLTATADTDTARGYAIYTPNARFTDLGTMFGVKVDTQGCAAVAVFAGEVHAECKTDGGWAAPVSLHRGEALAWEGTKFVQHSAAREDFPALVPPLPPPPPPPPPPQQEASFQRWQAFGKELQKRQDLAAYYDFQQDRNDPESLANKSPAGVELSGKIRGATWVEGRFPGKTALEFKRPECGVQVVLPKEMPACTLMAWVNIERLPQQCNGLLASDGWDQSGQIHWQVNGNGRLDFASRIRKSVPGIEGDYAPKMTSEPLWTYPPEASNRWCLLAMVSDSAAKQITCYYNGKAVETRQFDRFLPVKIGSATIGNWNKLGVSSSQNLSLDGRMDELMIFKSALSAEEIRKIYEAGKP